MNFKEGDIIEFIGLDNHIYKEKINPDGSIRGFDPNHNFFNDKSVNNFFKERKLLKVNGNSTTIYKTITEQEKENKFQIGDTVKVLGQKWGGHEKGTIGTIVEPYHHISEKTLCWQIKDKNGYIFYHCENEIELVQKIINNNPNCEESKNTIQNIMDKIITFAKDLALSKEEKLLRKYNLKNTCGNFTENAKEIVMQKLLSDNETYLVEIATKIEEEEKKNK